MENTEPVFHSCPPLRELAQSEFDGVDIVKRRDDYMRFAWGNLRERILSKYPATIMVFEGVSRYGAPILFCPYCGEKLG